MEIRAADKELFEEEINEPINCQIKDESRHFKERKL